MKGSIRVVMAGGGTGGHLYPGLAVAEALERAAAARGQEVILTWAATPRKVDQHLLTPFGTRYIQQPVQPFPGMTAFAKWLPFYSAWRKSCAYWRRDFAQSKTHGVVALGGYASGPAGRVAAKMGIPLLLLNPDALPGRANRYLAKHANVVAAQWPMPGTNVKVLGCPIRRELFGRSRAEGAAALGISPDLKTLVITGASLGAKTINDALLELLAESAFRSGFESNSGMLLTQDGPGGGAQDSVTPPVSDEPSLRQRHGNRSEWQILHLAGIEQAAGVQAAYRKWPQVRATVLDYCDDMASVWAVADLAIARAGASTCAELTACGVPSILLPYPFHKDMHQLANARELEKANAALIVTDEKDAKKNAASIQNALLPLLYDDARRQTMSQAARAIGKPAAADVIAAEILALIDASSR